MQGQYKAQRKKKSEEKKATRVPGTSLGENGLTNARDGRRLEERRPLERADAASGQERKRKRGGGSDFLDKEVPGEDDGRKNSG